MRYFFCALFLFSFYAKSVYACDASAPQARLALNKFLTGEYDGALDTRLTLAAYQKKEALIYGEQLNELSVPGVVLDLLADPIVIVDGFQIECRDYDAHKAVFKVTFNSLGKSTGSGERGRTLLFEKNVLEQTYILRLIDGQWLVLDPSISFVSLETIKTAYEERIKIMGDIKKLSSSQEVIYDDLVAKKMLIKRSSD